MDFKDKKCLIAMPCGSGFVPVATVQSLMALKFACSVGFAMTERIRTDEARNFFAKMAISQKVDYLLMIDDDNPVPADTLQKMLEDDKDIVIAPILTRNPNKEGEHTLCAFYTREEMIDDKPLKIYYDIKDFREEGYLHKIDGGGCGAILIKREVLEKLDKEYDGFIFEYGKIKFSKKYSIDGRLIDKRTMSEDVEFSERAIKAGFEMWLDERILPYHISQPKLVKYGKPVSSVIQRMKSENYDVAPDGAPC